MGVLVVIGEEQALRQEQDMGCRLELVLGRTADWIYCEPDIKHTEKHPNFRLLPISPGMYDLDLHDLGGLVTHDEARSKILAMGLWRAGSLHLFLEAIRQHPELLRDHPVVSNVGWTSPDGEHGVIYADLGLGDRPKLCIHYAQSGFSTRCRFLG